MASLNEIIRERRRFVRQLRSQQKEIDTRVEVVERKLISIISRKRKVPEDDDLAFIATAFREVVKGCNDFLSLVEKGFAI